MQLHVSPSDGVPIYQQVVNQIKYLVASGRLKQGEQLLPVRKLAEQLIVNPNTVARAYRELESDGVVESRRGSGVFVSEGVSPLAKREQNKILKFRELAASEKAWWPPVVQRKGPKWMTILDVIDAKDDKDYCAKVKKWGKSVWDEYADVHENIIKTYDEFYKKVTMTDLNA